jgi:hypothetical protein
MLNSVSSWCHPDQKWNVLLLLPPSRSSPILDAIILGAMAEKAYLSNDDQSRATKLPASKIYTYRWAFIHTYF